MPHVTRLEFLRRSLAATAAVTLAPCGGRAAAKGSDGAVSEHQIGVLVDLTRCIGCRACVRACSARNGLPQPANPTTAWDGPADTLTYNHWTAVNLEGTAQAEGPVPVKQQCLHCVDPACVSVCPVGAMRRLPSGAVVYR